MANGYQVIDAVFVLCNLTHTCSHLHTHPPIASPPTHAELTLKDCKKSCNYNISICIALYSLEFVYRQGLFSKLYRDF